MLGFGEVGHATEILPGTHDKRPAALPRWAFLPSEGDLRLLYEYGLLLPPPPNRPEDFRGIGLIIDLIRRYGIRASEVGPFSFEWDQKSEEQRQGILNLVRFAIPRNLYSKEHIDYTVAAFTELHEN